MSVDVKQWLDDKTLVRENPLGPDIAIQMMTKKYNMERTAGSIQWRMSKQPDWQGNKIADTDTVALGKIRDNLTKTAFKLNMTTAQATEIWDKLQSFLANPEFAKFVLDAHAAESEFFFSWLSCVPKAITLEAHFGYAPDLTGVFRQVPKTDPFWYWTQADPGLNLVGYRYKKTQNLMVKKHEILDLASGWFQWLRHGNYHPGVEKQLVYSCDLDAATDPKRILNSSVAGCTLSDETREKVEIRHKTLDARLMINQMIAEGRRFDVVNAGGILSYMMDDYDWICAKVVNHLLKPGGAFIHDLQLMHWCMKRDGAMFGWSKGFSNIHLMDNTDEAEARIKYAFAELDDVAYELDFDASNDEPLAVLVTAHKAS